jgi:hypothetical protein
MIQNGYPLNISFKQGKQRPRIDNFGGNTQRRPRLNMGCSAIEEEEEEEE